MEKDLSCDCPGPSGYVIEYYGIILLSLTIILMFLVICGLCFIIYRLRYRKYKGEIFVNSENGNTPEYIRQQSNEEPKHLPLKKISTLESPFNQSDILSIVETDVREKSKAESEALRSTKQEFARPVTGAKVTTSVSAIQPIITPDQMNKLCEAVLLKMKRNESTSLTHLNELVNDKDGKHNAGEKSAYNFEDEMEEYDVVPKPKKLHESSDDEEIEVYDCPPRNNAHDQDDDDYFDDEEERYQNASFIQRKML